MKNNQFKKVIRTEIEKQCKIADFVSVYVDETKNNRMIYIYTIDYKCVGIFSCWFSNTQISISFTNDLEKPMIISRIKDINTNYTQMDKVLSLIDNCFEIMDMTDN